MVYLDVSGLSVDLSNWFFHREFSVGVSHSGLDLEKSHNKERIFTRYLKTYKRINKKVKLNKNCTG